MKDNSFLLEKFISSPLQYINNFSQKRDKVSIAITSSNFIFLNFLGLPQGSISWPLYFAIYINNLSNHIAVPYPRVSLDTPVVCKGLICLYFVILSESQYFVIHLNKLE